MVMPTIPPANAQAMQEAQTIRQSSQQQARDREAQEPKRSVRLSCTFTVMEEEAVIGKSPATFRDVPPGTPIEVSQSEWKRLRDLGVIVDTVGETARGEPAEPVQQPSGATSTKPAALAGSSKLGADVEIGKHRVAVEMIVKGTQKASGKSVDEWNAVSADERDALLDAEIERRRAAAK